jgi:phosphate acetyltransferase
LIIPLYCGKISKKYLYIEVKIMLKTFRENAKRKNAKVIFAEGDEERTIEAAVRLVEDEVCKVCVAAKSKEAIKKAAGKKGLGTDGLEVLVPSKSLIEGNILKSFLDSRVRKGMSAKEAEGLVEDPLFFSALYVKSGKADGCVAGARSATSDVLRAAIQGIGAASGIKLVSSFFLMIPPQGHPVVTEPVLYADCGVNPNPSSMGLRDIAVASVKSFRGLFPGRDANVAFLSFSTKGSASHKVLAKVLEAVQSAKEFFASDSSVKIDGELQFDAAVMPGIAKRKAPDSSVAGKANIFIFPDLNSGNISYKITERLGRFTAIGPVVQGLEMPFNDLSRGCSVDDIYFAALITILQSATSRISQI